MASGSTIQNSLSAKLMVLLLIMPIISLHKTLDMSESEESLADVTGEYTTQALSDLNLEYGYDIAGEHIDFADINQGHVRFESDLDLAHNQVLQSASTGTVIATDVALSKQQEINACWVNLEALCTIIGLTAMERQKRWLLMKFLVLVRASIPLIVQLRSKTR